MIMISSRMAQCFLGIFASILLASASVNLHRERRAAVQRYSPSWPDGVIPYIIDTDDFTQNELTDLNFAFRTWNEETCVQFRPYRSGDKAWVRFKDGGRCWSQYLGYSGRDAEQLVILSRHGCRHYATYLHEMGHVLGLQHEHNRHNRDDYVYVDYNAIQPGTQNNFMKQKESQLLTYGSPYDFQSVMHYGWMAFGNPSGVRTIHVKDPKLHHLLRKVRNYALSFWDVMAINRHYKCESKCQEPHPNCTYPGFIDQHCRCQTPSEFERRWCVDVLDKSRCTELAENNECYRNSNYMSINCRQTCDFCYKYNPAEITLPEIVQTTTSHPATPLTACVEGQDPSSGCPKYRSQCDSVEVFRRCPNICGNCVSCKDSISQCEDLKEHDYCRLYPASTVLYCRKSCGACDA